MAVGKDSAPGAGSGGAASDEKGFAGLLALVMEKNKGFFGLLSNASLALEGDTLSITLVQSLGYLSGQLDQLEEICNSYYNKKINLKIEEGAAAVGAAPTLNERDSLVEDALKVLGGRVVEG